jgi:small subunit ribosomal protein S14
MAKISVVERNLKRVKLYSKYLVKREKLRAIIYNVTSSLEDKLAAQLQLQQLPRNSARIRQRNRCRICGRPRAFNRLTGLCRMHMRIAIMKGYVPGMHKDSW